MVYKKYVYKRGKTHGPYYYESYRDGDKVKKIYIGGEKDDMFFIFEIKHRNKLTNYNDVKEFLDKIKSSEFKGKKKRLFFISKSGFTEEAKKQMHKNKIEVIQ